MSHALEFAPWVLKFGVLPYLIVVLMPGPRSFVACLVLIGGAFTAVWIQHAIVVQSPGYKERIDDTIALALFAFATGSFLTGTVVRTVSLALAAGGSSPSRVRAINIAGLALLIAPFSVFAFW